MDWAHECRKEWVVWVHWHVSACVCVALWRKWLWQLLFLWRQSSDTWQPTSITPLLRKRDKRDGGEGQRMEDRGLGQWNGKKRGNQKEKERWVKAGKRNIDIYISCSWYGSSKDRTICSYAQNNYLKHSMSNLDAQISINIFLSTVVSWAKDWMC